MIANPYKFQAITIGSKDKCINEFKIDQEFAIKIEKKVTLLGVQIDENLMLISIRSVKKQLNS